jgi:CRP/FNR family cyclic AMP-dependent transcriptional regulator
MKEIREALANAFPFNNLNKKELDSLLEVANKVNLTRREVLYRPGMANEYVYLVTSGGIKVSKANGRYLRYIIDIYPPGSVIGEDGLTSSSPHDTEARPLDNAAVIRLDRKTVSRLLENNSRFAHAWLDLLGMKSRALREKMEDIVFKEVLARVASALFKLAKGFGRRDRNGLVIAARITHQDLADYIGASRETVSLALAELRRKKLIRMNVRRFVVPDMKSLKKAANSS